MAADPHVILADEPTANLDTTNGQQVMEIMKKLNKEGKIVKEGRGLIED